MIILWLFMIIVMIFRFLEILMKSKEKPREIIKNLAFWIHKWRIFQK